MNLVIDLGNTALKAGLFDDQLVDSLVFQPNDAAGFEQMLRKYKPSAVIISSVAQLLPAASAMLENIPHRINLNDKTPVPFSNLYQSPETLGTDRLSNAAGAHKMFPHEDVLTIDAGTCLKFDFINAKSEYTGGAISPGIKMRYKAMHEFTAALPLLEPLENPHLTGRNTNESMHSGVINGMSSEIDGIIEAYKKDHPALKVILTGGDSRYFKGKVKSGIFASPELTLAGLNAILRYNQ